MSKTESTGTRKGGVPSKQSISLKAQGLADKALKVWEEALKDPNANIRLGAANKIMDKAIPDMKMMELTGPDGGPLQLKYIIDLAGGYIPPLGAFNGPSTRSDPGSTSIQSLGVAPTSQENNDSSNGTS